MNRIDIFFMHYTYTLYIVLLLLLLSLLLSNMYDRTLGSGVDALFNKTMMDEATEKIRFPFDE